MKKMNYSSLIPTSRDGASSFVPTSRDKRKTAFTPVKFTKSNHLTGFTLIETLIAVFILSMGIVGVLAVFPIGIQVEKSAQILTVANQLAQAKIEENISKSYSEIGIGTTTEEYGSISDYPYFKILVRTNYYDPLELTSTDTDSGIKKIEVFVFWKSPLGSSEKSTRLESLISKR